MGEGADWEVKCGGFKRGVVSYFLVLLLREWNIQELRYSSFPWFKLVFFSFGSQMCF